MSGISYAGDNMYRVSILDGSTVLSSYDGIVSEGTVVDERKAVRMLQGVAMDVQPSWLDFVNSPDPVFRYKDVYPGIKIRIVKAEKGFDFEVDETIISHARSASEAFGPEYEKYDGVAGKVYDIELYSRVFNFQGPGKTLSTLSGPGDKRKFKIEVYPSKD